MPGGSQNKTEKPTAKRRSKARQEGQIAQSQEVNNFLVLSAALAALLLFGSNIWSFLIGNAAMHLADIDGLDLTQKGVATIVTDKFAGIGVALAPFLFLILVGGLVASLSQTKMLFSTKIVKPKLNAVNPISGFKKLFKLSTIVQLLVSIAKLIAVGCMIYLVVRWRIHWFFGLVGMNPWGIVMVAQQFFLILILVVLVCMLIIAVLDYSYQRYKHEKQLMMTKEEVKEERKQAEGDPKVKGRQASERRKIYKSRMAQAVPGADVVVANPKHYAVALRWVESEMDAPMVVAKGKDLFALRIKKIAKENDVPILERKLLARTLYETVDVDTEIPPQLYHAVAEVLAFVMKKRN